MILVCGFACGHRDNPQASFDHAYKTFLHGDLKQSQDEAHEACLRFGRTSLDWAWKFRVLEAESLLWRGMYAEVISVLESQPVEPKDDASIVELLAIKGVADARLHEFAKAEEALDRAERICRLSPAVTCGDVDRSRGILAVQFGEVEIAKGFFERSLKFARAREQPFLEVTALINLGKVSLDEEHFDEAIDWSNEAYQASSSLDASGEAQMALGNLGWAYYNLGDSEKSLELSLEAEEHAKRIDRVIGELSWITNAGYVYAQKGDVDRAKQSYLTALELANRIGARGEIYNSFRALALVSVQTGDLDNAHKYANEAIQIARTDHNRLDELYPLLVTGMLAARANDSIEAERIFREIESAPYSNASLKWRSEHNLAQVYVAQGRANDADREYRAALSTFEGARSSLKRNDAKLPFLNNASRIYDDYVHFLIAQGKSEEALRWADYSRARTLTEGLGVLGASTAAGPPAIYPQQIAQRAGGTLLFYWLGEKQSYLWAITSQKTSLFTLPPRAEIEAAAQRYRKAVTGPQDVLQAADPDGQALYRMLVAPAHELLKKDARVFIIPDGSLNNLNFETLLAPDSDAAHSKLHYWIEDVMLADASSLRMLGAARTTKAADKPKSNAALLLIGNSLAPNKNYPELPKAGSQVESVARHFPSATKTILTRENATPAAYLSGNPERFSYIHFVAHGTASRLSPLDSAIVLSKTSPSRGDTEDNSFKLYARDIIQHPLHAELVTISACYGAGERAYSGEGLVGLSWAFLRTGAHHVVAALWEATDSSTERLMDKFYGELDRGADPGTALRTAKLSLLRDSPFKNPFYWAPFQLYLGSSSAKHN